MCKLKGVYDVINKGVTVAPQSILRFFVSTDGNLAITDSVFSQSVIGALAPNQTQRVTFSVKLPRGASAYGLHMIAFVDAIGAVVETDERNNTVAFGPIQ